MDTPHPARRLRESRDAAKNAPPSTCFDRRFRRPSVTGWAVTGSSQQEKDDGAQATC